MWRLASGTSVSTQCCTVHPVSKTIENGTRCAGVATNQTGRGNSPICPGTEGVGGDPEADLLAYEHAKGTIVVRLLTCGLGVSLQGKRALEIGCSTGALMQLLEDHGADAHGVDVESTWSGHYSYRPEKRTFLDLQHQEPQPQWRETPFDLVIAQEVIEHLERPYDFLRRIWQILKPGGHLFLTTPNLAGVTACLRGARWCGVDTEGHVILYSPRSLDFTVANCGFRKIKTFTNLVPIYHQARHPWLRWVNRATTWTRIGGGLMGLYQKVEFPSIPGMQSR